MPLEIRPSQALRLWRQVHLDLVRDGQADLSARQTAILLTVYLELPPHTVRGLAQQLGERTDPVERGLEPGLGPAGEQRVLHLGQGLGEAGGVEVGHVCHHRSV